MSSAGFADAKRQRQQATMARVIALQPQWEPVAFRSGIMDVDSATLTIVPGTAAPIVPSDPARHAELETYLRDLADDLSEAGSPAGTNSEERAARHARSATAERDSFGTACTLCRGGCCQAGATQHGFIDRDMIRLYLHRHPDSTPDQAVDAYVGYLPALSVEGSCAYHGEAGCALPRDMRAQVCNQTRCSALEDIAYGERAGTASTIAVSTSRDQSTVTGVAAISATGTSITRLDQ